jgi:hypothetical protein
MRKSSSESIAGRGYTPQVSKHLRVLREVGVVGVRDAGRPKHLVYKAWTTPRARQALVERQARTSGS